MRRIYFASGLAILLLIACDTKKKETGKKYTDFFGYNLKGDVKSIQDSMYVVDSNGKQMPDSLSYGLGEFKDGNLISYTDIDTNGKKSIGTYDYFENGLWKGMQAVENGKTVYKLNIQLDSAGHYASAQSYDSTGKMDYYNAALVMNEDGRLLSGKLYKSDSTLKNSFTNVYDKKNYIGGSSFDSTGKEVSKTTVTLNEQGDRIEEKTVSKEKDSSITKIKKYSYTYDNTGNWVQQTEMNEKGKPVKINKRVITYGKKEN